MSQYRKDVLDDLIEDPGAVRKKARARTFTWLIGMLVAIIVAAILALLSYNAVQSIKTRNALLDCTQPDGDCAQRSQKSTVKLVQSLLDAGEARHKQTRRIVVLAAACADQPGNQSVDDIKRCVNKQLNK